MFRSVGIAIKGRGLIGRAPQLVPLYLRNRLRSASVRLDARRPSGYSLPPRCVTLRVTLRCNLRCRMCRYVTEAAARGELEQLPVLPGPIATRVAGEAARLGAYVAITGGEPLLYNELPALVAEVKRHGGVCVLATNGTLLERRAEELVRAGPDLVTVSVLGPPAIHDAITQVDGAFDRVAAGIEAMRSHGNGRTGLIVNTPISSANIGHLRELTDIVRGWPIDAMNIQHLWFITPEMLQSHHQRFGSLFRPCVTEMDDDAIQNGGAEELARELTALRSMKLPFPLHIFPDFRARDVQRYYQEPSVFLGRRKTRCAWLLCHIGPSGDVLPCEGYKAGNVLDSSLADVWNGKRFRAFRRRLAEHGAFPICSRCCSLWRRD